jgi:16S rRNA (cytosine1402-N4)-methyltransferase
MRVNCDLESLESALQQALRIMAKGGRLVVIAYHSLEDRLVKMFMKREAKDCICHPNQTCCTCDHRASITILTRKVVKPTREESQNNPRVRSARLRACSVLEQSLVQGISG